MFQWEILKAVHQWFPASGPLGVWPSSIPTAPLVPVPKGVGDELCPVNSVQFGVFLRGSSFTLRTLYLFLFVITNESTLIHYCYLKSILSSDYFLVLPNFYQDPIQDTILRISVFSLFNINFTRTTPQSFVFDDLETVEGYQSDIL